MPGLGAWGSYDKVRAALAERRGLLERLGGLPLALLQVANEEWLYMLQEDTRHSLAIEGYFATERELEAVVQGRRGSLEVLNYFRTAQYTYGLAFQYHKESQLHLDLPLINNIHAMLFQGTTQDRYRGQPADGIKRQIAGAPVQPPLEATDYLRAFVKLALWLLREREALEALAKTHALFEAIHPYRDGNGRVGRILLNYLALLQGLPPLAIKGLTQKERERYYAALQEADRGFHRGFPPPEPEALLRALDLGEFRPLALLLAEALAPRLDNLVALALIRFHDLKPLEEVAQDLGVSRVLVYQWVSRGRLVVYRPRGGKRPLSHPWLFLGTREHPPVLPPTLPPERPSWEDRIRDLQQSLWAPRG
ncbi:Fic family protein [Thermus tengchongensis]|uniref:Fic family protein n=1 Tax=Thermus tengchongensis TaxID=1214928 RepID=A0A4Y9F9U1_9DEIN|nr:Fic family protein [Thermus tengchongensis]TFU25871.1 Fic family protein [Thermus tengchongensis]